MAVNNICGIITKTQSSPGKKQQEQLKVALLDFYFIFFTHYAYKFFPKNNTTYSESTASPPERCDFMLSQQYHHNVI